MGKWWVLKRLFPKVSRSKNIPRINKSLANPLSLDSLDSDYVLALMSGRFRDVAQIDHAMKKYKASNPVELLHKLPPPPPVKWGARLKRILLALDGSAANDPFRKETIALMRQAKRSQRYDGSYTRFNRRGRGPRVIQDHADTD